MPRIANTNTRRRSTTRNRLFTQPKMMTTKVEVQGDEVTFKLPADVLAHIELNENQEVHWTVVNGVIQISGGQPQMVIPVFSEGHEFEAQP